MKKVVKVALALFGAALVLAACSNASGGGGGDNGGSGNGGFGDEIGNNGSLQLPAGLPAGCVYVPSKTFDGTISGAAITGSRVFIANRKLTLPAIYASDHEVTQGEYESYCIYHKNPSEIEGKGENYPAYYINWYDAIVYCNLKSKADGLTPCYKMGTSTDATDVTKWIGIVAGTGADAGKYCGPSSDNAAWNAITFDTAANGWRLPTEAEWEMLARGGNLTNENQTIWSGSDMVGDVAWCIGTCRDNGENETKPHEVKGKMANALGLYDMSGNVLEWCWDLYKATLDADTPWTGPEEGYSSETRWYRGGYVYHSADYCALAENIDSGLKGALKFAGCYVRGVGFRVVRNASSGGNQQQTTTTYSITVTNGTAKNSAGILVTSAKPGSAITITAGDPEIGKIFDKWTTSNVGVAFASATSSITAFIMPSSDVSVTATYKDITPALPGAQAAITIDGIALQMTSEVLIPGTTIVGKTNANNYEGVFINGRMVALSSFIMGKYEVTQELYKKVMTGNSLGVSEEPSSFKNNPADGETQDWRPVEQVTWYDAVYFCNELTKKTLGESEKVYTITNTTVSEGRITSAKVTVNLSKKGYRLPTEAEWEFAARGGNPAAEAWGYTFSGAPTASGVDYTADKNAAMDNVGWYCFNSDNKTHQVGKKPVANACGLYDMSGNVLEWCWDIKDNIRAETVANPMGVSSGSTRALRGGCWGTRCCYEKDASVCCRLNGGPSNCFDFIGFRVVRTFPSPRK